MFVPVPMPLLFPLYIS